MSDYSIRDFITWHEGDKLQPYQDVSGIWTIGRGHVIKDNEQWMKNGITQQQSDDILDADLQVYYQAVDNSVNVPITESQRDSLMDFCFGNGIGAFQSSTLLKLINSGASDSDISAEFMKWDHAMVGGKLVEIPHLKEIRACEVAMWTNSMVPAISAGVNASAGGLAYFQKKS